MKILKNKPLIFIFSYLLAVALYWPSLNGSPAWDDFPYWFNDPVMTPSMSYLEILKNFAWPFSVSLQKVLYTFFQDNYFVYHAISLFIHGLNAYLVYKLARLLRVKYPFLFFFLFLIHPACVISVAWMIQIKTLLCFFFALSSCLTFIKGNKNLRWMTLSWILFLLSVTSKSASLSLPLFFLVVSFKSYHLKKLHLLIPFFLISFWGVYKVAVSPITIEGSAKASKVIDVKPEPKPAPTAVQTPSEIPMAPTSNEVRQDIPSAFNFARFDIDLIAKTLHYYFWQSLVPISNEPVKGLNPNKAGLAEYGHLLFILIVVFICWKDSALLYLAAGHFLLLPFLGIIPAPYMIITWVSDQHLYLALPALLAFWMRLLDKIKWEYRFILPSLLAVFFIYKTTLTTPYYKDQISFYKASLYHDPTNVPIAYNLAFAYVIKGDWVTARSLLHDIIERSEDDPSIKNNQFYVHIVKLYFDLQPKEQDEN